ncbi:hypothetical protein RDABS01_040208, partial [Bienertia sinuspersici]
GLIRRKMNNKAVAIPVLPEHLIEEQILPRLPVKSLIRFKSVSRSWLSVICSHDFQKLHLKFSSSCQTQAITLKSHLAFPSCLLSFDNCNNFKNCVELEANFRALNLPNCYGPPYSCTRLVSSCNGLVCLCFICVCFFLWNPATNQSQMVNLPDSCYHMSSVLLRGVGFGYVSSIDDYRIGFMLGDFDHNPKVRAYIYSFRAREWITMTSVDYELCRCATSCVVVDDTLYLSSATFGMLRLNLVSGQVKLFPLDGLPNFKHCKYKLSRMKGCLSLCQTGYSNKDGYKYVSDVWMLKQPDKWDSWEKLFSIRGDMYLHYVFEAGKCLVYREEQLKLIDPYDVAPEQFEEGDFDHNPKVRAYIFSLRAREWITMTTVDSELCCGARNCVVVDDTLYLSCVTLPLCIPGLNLVSGQVKLFPLDGLPNFKHCKYQLSRMKGCLSLCQTGYSNKDGYKYVWMLKQPDKWDSWEKLFSIRGDMYLHYVFETGKCLVSREEQLKLIDPYDVAPEQFEEGTTFCQESRKGVELRDIYQTWSYVESFISPFGAFTSSEDEDNSREIEIVESSDI